MPRKRRAAYTYRKTGPPPLTDQQTWDLLLGSAVGAYSSVQDRRRDWFAHRDELMGSVNLGTRPQAWWDFEAPEPKRRREHDYEALARMNLLTPEERALLQAQAQQATRKKAAPEPESPGGSEAE